MRNVLPMCDDKAHLLTSKIFLDELINSLHIQITHTMRFGKQKYILILASSVSQLKFAWQMAIIIIN